MNGHQVNSKQCSLLEAIPTSITDMKSLQAVTSVIASSNVCMGNPDFVELCRAKGGEFKSRSNSVMAYLDVGYPLAADKDETVRHVKCQLLVDSTQCNTCCQYKRNLAAMKRKGLRTASLHKNTNLRYLLPSEKAKRIRSLRNAVRNQQRHVARLQEKLQSFTETSGVPVDEALGVSIRNVIEKEHPDMTKLPVNDFRRIFWEQQV